MYFSSWDLVVESMALAKEGVIGICGIGKMVH